MTNKIRTVDYGSEITEIGVISDTHIPARARYLPPEIFREFKDVQLILHAGDLVDEKVMIELSALAPVEAVAGNMDSFWLQRKLGKLKLIRIGQLAIGLLHGDIAGRRVSFDQVQKLFLPLQPQAIVFGHLHEPLNRSHEGTLFFNPGSATDPRRVARPSIGRLRITKGSIQGEIIYL
ncbi:MAG: YfcE family phosphodiesterase [Dethiobacteria bacterium]|nr:metallophosphoesterase [Bacillota bacterium]